MFGRHERVRRGGYPSRRAAEAARDELIDRSSVERTTQTWTVARWLRYWLTTRTSIRPSTLRSYSEHVEKHLTPYLGRIRLGELTGRDVAAMFAALSTINSRYGRPLSPSTLHRIRATLRSALNAAIRDGLLRDNPARLVELPAPPRAARSRRYGLTIGSTPGSAARHARRWRCGRRGSWPPSSTVSPRTGCSRCGG
jgi:hypothetical protein